MSQINSGTGKRAIVAGIMIAAPDQYAGTKAAELPHRKALINVIDDDSDVLKSLRFLLETEGFDVRTFRSGSALLGSQARNKADCLIIDYKMSGIDGLELTSRLRELGITTPVVLITGYADDNIAERAALAGVHEVLIKPDLGDNLLASVRNATNLADNKR